MMQISTTGLKKTVQHYSPEKEFIMFALTDQQTGRGCKTFMAGFIKISAIEPPMGYNF